jgi:hypothetical protein
MIKIRRVPEFVLAAAIACLTLHSEGRAQQPPDSERTRADLEQLMRHYPPTLQRVIALDPSLLGSQPYLSAYPALQNFLASHPEIARNPSYYFGDRQFDGDRESPSLSLWRQFLSGAEAFLAFGMAIGVVVWLIRTVVDYRRWSRLARVQTDAHTKILDRFTDNADLLAYIQSHAGKRFLESTPIMLEAGPRQVSAPMGRILWSVQAGLVITAAGIGLYMVGGQFMNPRIAGNAFGPHPLQVLGALAMAVGIGFVVSAGASFVISKRLGLIGPSESARIEAPGGE